MRLLVVILLLPLLMCCKASRQSSSESVKQEGRSISFLTFSISKSTFSAPIEVKLISKKESAGTVKRKQAFPLVNYLTVYAFAGKQCVDSAIVDHPLIRHFEYMDAHDQFVAKDTVMNSAEFFVRLQGNFNRVKVFETLKGNQPKQIQTIDL